MKEVKRIIDEIVDIREEKDISQTQLAEYTGLKQPAIARLESLKSIPRLDTLLRVLDSLGYTLTITPKKNK